VQYAFGIGRLPFPSKACYSQSNGYERNTSHSTSTPNNSLFAVLVAFTLACIQNKRVNVLISRTLILTLPSAQDAASFAYDQALSPIHPYVVRTAVWAGMYVLPSRQVFMTSIGETEESALEPSTTFTTGSPAVEAAILALYDEPMPASDVAPTSMFTASSWWGTTATAKADAVAEAGPPTTATNDLPS
jgi:hypothetical protein